MSTKKALYTFVFLLLILNLSGCMTNSNQIHLKSTKEISTLGKACEDIVRLQIETWDTRDAEKLREIYTDDIVHFDANPSLAAKALP